MTGLVFCPVYNLILEITFPKDRHPGKGHHGHNTGCKIKVNGICGFIVRAFLHGIEFNNEKMGVVLL